MVRQPLVYIANKNTARSGASSIVVTVGTSPPGQGEDRRTDHGSTDQRRKRRIPTGPLYEQPEAPTRNDRASVAEQPAESARRGCGPFGCDIGRSDSCPEKIVSIMLNHISCIVSLRAIEIRLFVHIQYY